MKKSMQRIILGLALCLPLLAQAEKPVFLITAIQKAPSTIYSGQTATATYQVVNNTPFDLNSNGVIDLPVGVTQAGGSCVSPFYLAPGASCTLGLQIVADALTGDVRGGPKVCNTLANPIYCSWPSSGNELIITKSNNPAPVNTATLSMTPTAVSFVSGDSSSAITLHNDSTSVAASALILTPSANLSVVNNTCGAALAPQTSCTFEVSSATVSTGNSVTIQGGNTNTLVLDVTVTALPLATISVTPAALSLTEGGPAQAVVLSNTSATAVDNLQVTIPGTSAITIDAGNTTCTSTLAANSSCQYSFLPGSQSEVSTIISINGSNTTAGVTVTVQVNAVTIEASPFPSLGFVVGNTGTITVTNTSTTTAVTNVQATLPGSNIIISNTTCTGTLSASATCTIELVAGAPEANQVLSIHGDNSNTVQVTVTAQSSTPILSISSPALANRIINVNDLNPLVLTITNSTISPSDTTLSTTLPAGWAGVTVIPDSNCIGLQPGSSCTLSLVSIAPFIPGELIIAGTNAANTLTTYVAMRMNGGLVFSVTGASPGATVKVAQESDNGFRQWGDDVFTGATDINDGQTNTTTIVNTSGIGANAAAICDDLTSGGFTDWYLPAICELGRKNTSLPSGDAGCGTTTPNMFSTLFSVGFGDFGVGYWSSTEFAPNLAWSQYFGSPTDGRQIEDFKSNLNVVRCVRAFVN
ncbi:DUF1566 domain-containing protein [uncultured Legionella sp.]|uniref:Lcl C-terminal domain-containing protein n=1 Tax=uncultured Legionella sp. TaxID=210934 RepID=UPI0026116392|nr:DUF1566 domain-containing protein [uncultured Legionella sp.]